MFNLKSIAVALTLTSICCLSALAQDEAQQTSTERKMVKETSIKDEVVGVSPQVGMIGYNDINNNYTSRAVGGLGIDWNLAPMTKDDSVKDSFVGISTGAFFSHIGATNSGFFGGTSGSDVPNGSNLLLIPADLKAGLYLTPKARLSAHAGGNVIYRSAAGSLNLGDGSVGTDSLWKVYPNGGLDFEVQISKNVNFIARPDVTLSQGTTMILGTIGATFMAM